MQRKDAAEDRDTSRTRSIANALTEQRPFHPRFTSRQTPPVVWRRYIRILCRFSHKDHPGERAAQQPEQPRTTSSERACDFQSRSTDRQCKKCTFHASAIYRRVSSIGKTDSATTQCPAGDRAPPASHGYRLRTVQTLRAAPKPDNARYFWCTRPDPISNAHLFPPDTFGARTSQPPDTFGV